MTKDAAKMLGKSAGTLANDRLYGRGLPYIKAGGRILYDTNDIVQYLEKHKIDPEELTT
jgi:hypothetical protein